MKDKTKVSITEKAPDPDRIVHDLRAVRQLMKHYPRLLEARKNRRRAIGTGLNKSRQEDAQRDKSIAFELRDRLIRQDPVLGLPRTHNKMAGLIRRHWPKRKKIPGHRTIYRYLTEK
jgi:hypothetical protein